MFTIRSEPTVSDDNRQPSTRRTKEIAQRISRVRLERAVSQRDMCDKLGISQPMMSHYERGERRIPADLLAQIAELLDVTADELLGLKRSKRNSQEMSSEMKKLWKKFQQVAKLPDHDRRAVIRLINSVSKAKAK